jgi:pilus assembly protein CpaE
MNVASQISTSIDIAAATNAGTPIISASPHHPSSAAFRNLSALLVGEPAGVGAVDRSHAADTENDRFAKLFRIKR